MPKARFFRPSVVAAVLTLASSAEAADTTETFDPGSVDIELYTGAHGLGLGTGEATVVGETVLGVGIANRISAYARGAGSANERLEDGDGEAALGLFGTPIDTDHFDFDMGLDVGWTPGSALITPGVELNLDAAPDLALAGVYLRGEESLVTREEPAADPSDRAPAVEAAESASGKSVLAPSTLLTLGSYWTMVDGHQFLIEADAGVAHRPSANEETFDLGGVALGYNCQVHQSIELISQVFVDVPIRDGEAVSAGVSIGLIGTAPIVPANTDDGGDRHAGRARARR